MKKFVAFCLAFVFFIGTLFIYNGYLDRGLLMRKNNLKYDNDSVKLQSITAIAKSLDARTMLVLGSSELYDSPEASFPGNLFDNGNSDFNMSFVGYGNYCSLQHAIYIGALAGKMLLKKVVLIVSPQWFGRNYTTSDAFSSRFSQRAFDEFIKNTKISKETKKKIVDRCETLLVKDPKELRNVKLYHSVYLNGSLNVVDRLYLTVNNWFQEFRTKSLAKRYTGVDKKPAKPQVRAENIDFDRLMDSSEQEGKANSTDNPFYIADTYYDTTLVPQLNGQKNAYANSSFLDSTEYGDLRLFLEVCKETGIRPLLVSIPVNGYWYDYTAFPKADRQQYYQNIRDIASEYGAPLADLSSDEYTPYFFKDIWHIGWKGWAAVDKSIYEFYKKDEAAVSQ